MAGTASVPVARARPAKGELGAGARAFEDPAVVGAHLVDASGRPGDAAALFRPASEAELAAVLARASGRRIPVTLAAAQTSTTASSVPRGGWVVSLSRLRDPARISRERRRARAGAGWLLGDFQRAVAEAGLFYPPDPTSRNECSLGGSVACNASGARSFQYGATRRWVRGLRVVLACGEVLALERGEVVSEGEDFEIVLAEGERLRVPLPRVPAPRVAKHAAGYPGGPPLDLIDLFIGSEGTLGAISEVEVALLPDPGPAFALFAGLAGADAGLDFVARARAGEDGVAPRCLEWFDAAALAALRRAMPELAIPAAWSVAVYAEQECGEEAEARWLERWAALLTACGVSLEGDVRFASSESEIELLRRARHAVPAAVNERAARNGMPKVGTDLAVPPEHLPAFARRYELAARDPRALLSADERRELVSSLAANGDAAKGDGPPLEDRPHSSDAHEGAGPADQGRSSSREDRPHSSSAEQESDGWSEAGLPDSLESVTFGHVGDGHLHVNFLPQSAAGLALAEAVYDRLTREAIALGGTPSAEHGIGKIKHRGLAALVGESGVAAMRATKRALDPAGVLCPGNLFPPED